MAEIKITFPDGAQRTFESGTTLAEIVHSLSQRLAKETLVARIDGRIVDLSTKVLDDSTVEFLTFDSEEGEDVFRHSSNFNRLLDFHSCASVIQGRKLLCFIVKLREQKHDVH